MGDRTWTYIVVRHGSNAANQHMTEKMVLGTVDARDRVHAAALAHSRWTCYANQFFRFIPLSRASQRLQDDAAIADAQNA